MTHAELQAAVAAGRCTWDQVALTLEGALVPLSEQIEILARRAVLRPNAALMLEDLVRTGEAPMGELPG